MQDKINLKELEKKAFTSYHRDGFLDIMLGLILLIGVLSSTLHELGVSDTIRVLIYMPLMFIVPFSIMYFGKKKITIPRLGLVKFSEKRKRDRNKLIAVILIMNVFILFVFLATITGQLDQISTKIGIKTTIWMAVIIFSAIFTFFILFAYLNDNPRLYLSGFLMAITEPIYTSLELFSSFRLKGLIAYGIPGFLLLSLGTFTFIQFLNNYPKVTKELSNA